MKMIKIFIEKIVKQHKLFKEIEATVESYHNLMQSTMAEKEALKQENQFIKDKLKKVVDVIKILDKNDGRLRQVKEMKKICKEILK